MSKLIMLRGNSGSGKTTVAKELQKKFGRNTMIISQDAVRREILKVNDGPATEALPLMQELLIYGKRHCEITILEGIMYANWYKPVFERAVHEFGEEEMKRWWREKDYIGFIKENVIAIDETLEDIVERIYSNITERE